MYSFIFLAVLNWSKLEMIPDEDIPLIHITECVRPTMPDHMTNIGALHRRSSLGDQSLHLRLFDVLSPSPCFWQHTNSVNQTNKKTSSWKEKYKWKQNLESERQLNVPFTSPLNQIISTHLGRMSTKCHTPLCKNTKRWMKIYKFNGKKLPKLVLIKNMLQWVISNIPVLQHNLFDCV